MHLWLMADWDFSLPGDSPTVKAFYLSKNEGISIGRLTVIRGFWQHFVSDKVLNKYYLYD